MSLSAPSSAIGIARAAAEIEHVARLRQLMGERLVRPFVAQHRRHMARHLAERLDELGLERRADHAARLAGGDGEAGEHRRAGR